MESKFACYDIDGTLAKSMLFVPLVISEHSDGIIDDESFAIISSLLSKYKNGELLYEDAVQQLLKAHAQSLAGINVADLNLHTKEFIENNLNLFRSFANTVITLLRQKSLHQVAVTAEPEYLANAVVEHFDLDGSFSTVYEIVDGAYSGKITASLAGNSSKSEVLSHYFIEFAFGDSEGDIEMLEMAEYPFCVEPTDELARVAKENNWRVYDKDSQIVADVKLALQK